MKARNPHTATLILGLLCLWQAPRLLAQNLLVNGDFEAGNTGFTSDYTYSPGNIASEGTYDVVRNPHDSHPGGASFGDHTSGTGLMLAANGASNTNLVVWRQSVAVAANTTYEFSGWGASWGDDGGGHDPSPSRIVIIINGSTVGSTTQLSGIDGQWQRFSVLWYSTTSQTAQIELRLDNPEAFGNDPAFDDFEFVSTSTPTPILTILPCVEVICWQSLSGARYQVQRSPNPHSAHWENVGAPVTGTGDEICVPDDHHGMPRRIYRLQVLQ